MKILFLSPHKHLVGFLESFGDKVVQTIEPLTPEILSGADWIISYGYRHKISVNAITAVKGKAINLHISYLPWNRGADPNLWSFLENTPKGVTIHFIDEGIDTGPIIARRSIDYDLKTDTLKSTYKRLSDTIEELFIGQWPLIMDGIISPLPQLTYHRAKDKEKYEHLLTQGWDTLIKDIIGRANVLPK